MPATKLTGHIDSQRFRFLPPDKWELEIVGWVLDPNQSIQELKIYLGEKIGRVTRRSRADLLGMLPNIAHASEGGFEAKIIADYFEGLRHELRFEANLKSGELIVSQVALDLRNVRFEGEVRADSKDLYGSEESRQKYRKQTQASFDVFMSSHAELSFSKHEKPDLSIILVTFNQADLTYNCLKSLRFSRDVKFELILIDNASEDRSKELFARLRGVKVVENSANLHFIAAANQGAALASADLILFLNNDTAIEPAALKNACKVMVQNPKLGALGGKLLRPDGRLQEAGCYILRDGSTFGFGISDDPADPRYAEARLVDYCSGAFLLTRLNLFRRLGGFDQALAPAYFEDVDYCIGLQKLGFDVRYEPSVAVLHAEKSSSGSVAVAEALTRKNRRVIRKKHREYLLKKTYGPIRPELDRTSQKIVMIDNAYPDASQGQGFPRAVILLEEVLKLGWEVVFLALNQADLPELESMPALVTYCAVSDDLDFEAKLTFHALEAKVILVSRSPNMERFSELMDFIPTISPHAKIIFDAESLFAARAILEAKILDGLELTAQEQSDIIHKETKLAERAHAVFTVSEPVAQVFVESGARGVSVLSHVVNVCEQTPGFETRLGILMVGPLLEARTPNADGFRWFVSEVMPRLLAADQANIFFDHAGKFQIDEFKSLLSSSTRCLGLVQNLKPLYDSHKIFVAPMRFGAGIPLKILEAAGQGIPIVTTSLLAGQLAWSDQKELLVADTAEDFCACCLRLFKDANLWAALVEQARERVRAEYSFEKFHSGFQHALKTLNIL